jgi:hypothetical protein
VRLPPIPIDRVKTSEERGFHELDGLVRDAEGRGGSGRESLAPTADREIVQFVACPRNLQGDEERRSMTSWIAHMGNVFVEGLFFHRRLRPLARGWRSWVRGRLRDLVGGRNKLTFGRRVRATRPNSAFGGEGSGGRDPSSLRLFKPCNPSVRPARIERG